MMSIKKIPELSSYFFNGNHFCDILHQFQFIYIFFLGNFYFEFVLISFRSLFNVFLFEFLGGF